MHQVIFFFSNFVTLDIAVDHQALLKQFEYLNHMNPHTFEVDDLDLLIKSVNITTHWTCMCLRSLKRPFTCCSKAH